MALRRNPNMGIRDLHQDEAFIDTLLRRYSAAKQIRQSLATHREDSRKIAADL